MKVRELLFFSRVARQSDRRNQQCFTSFRHISHPKSQLALVNNLDRRRFGTVNLALTSTFQYSLFSSFSHSRPVKMKHERREGHVILSRDCEGGPAPRSFTFARSSLRGSNCRPGNNALMEVSPEPSPSRQCLYQNNERGPRSQARANAHFPPCLFAISG